MSYEYTTYLVCKNGQLVDLTGNSTWTNTNVDIITNGGRINDDCMFFKGGPDWNKPAISYITSNQSGLWDFADHDFTIQFFFKMDQIILPQNKYVGVIFTLGTHHTFALMYYTPSNSLCGFSLELSNNGTTWDYEYEMYPVYTDENTGQQTMYISDNTWMHIAITRQGNVFRGFCDGHLMGELTVPEGYTIKSENTQFMLGVYNTVSNIVFNQLTNSYIDHFSIVIGKALYTKDFSSSGRIMLGNKIINNVKVSD